MTRRAFLQAIPGVLPICQPHELPPAMALSPDEFEHWNALVNTELARTPDRTTALEKGRAILRAAVRVSLPIRYLTIPKGDQ